jgi:hypothetical protein
VVFPLNDEVRRYYLAIRIYSLDHRNLLPITRLLRTRLTAAFPTYYNLYTRKYIYLEPSLVEVIDIPFLDRVLINNVSYKPKLYVYYVGIFVLGPLVIDSASKTRRKLVISVYKFVRPSGSDA